MPNLTMTVREVVKEMREAGIHCSDRIVSDGIAFGIYPFGTVVNTGETGRRTLNIFRVDFEAWLQSKMPKAVPDLHLQRKTG